jgi:hypothetical protein
MSLRRDCVYSQNVFSTEALSNRIAGIRTACLIVRRVGLMEGALQCGYGCCTPRVFLFSNGPAWKRCAQGSMLA